MPRAEMSKITKKRLDALIAEATVDAYDEDEQHIGLMTMIEECVELPFDAKVIGETVRVVAFEMPSGGYGLKAVC